MLGRCDVGAACHQAEDDRSEDQPENLRHRSPFRPAETHAPGHTADSLLCM
jgi:hypothetical protein